MEKYGDASKVVETLLKMKVCETEEEAMEKVASGEAPDLIKDFKMRLFNDMVTLYQDQLGPDMDPKLVEEFNEIKKELKET